MQKLALGAVIAFVVACGNSGNNKVHIVTDSSGSGSDATCNPLTQTGCTTGQMCTWVYDLVSADGTNILGHVGCAPGGDKAVGAQCTRNAAGAQGWDDCATGGFCRVRRELVATGGVGVCEKICDNNGGDPTCGSDAACVAYNGIFDVASTNVAGVCDVKCDPFNDNDFHHQGSATPVRPGTKCQAYEGCYGYPGRTLPTSFSCAREYNTDLHNRNQCTATSGNSLTSANPLTRVGCSTASNGCAEGYMPLLYEDTSGSMIAVCTAMCKPASCYAGHCGSGANNSVGSGNLTGDPTSGHQCQPSDILGTFSPAVAGPAGHNGAQCTYNWAFEFDTQGNFISSSFDNTMGWCEEHDQYQYDGNGDGMITSGNLALDPIEDKCDTIATVVGTGSAVSGACTIANGCRGAASFGCVTSTEAGVMFKKQGNVLINNMPNRPHPAYGLRPVL